jgi:hypothetical protein
MRLDLNQRNSFDLRSRYRLELIYILCFVLPVAVSAITMLLRMKQNISLYF